MPVAAIVIEPVLPTTKSVVTFALVVMLPVTVRSVNVPTLVTLGCAAVVSVPPSVVPLMSVALTLPAPMLPVTVRSVSVPTLVIFG